VLDDSWHGGGDNLGGAQAEDHSSHFNEDCNPAQNLV
jgi:hypothetical protein